MLALAATDLEARLHQLLRGDLDSALPQSTAIWGLLEKTPMLRLSGQAAFWRTESDSGYAQRMDDLLTGLHGIGRGTFLHVLWSQRTHVELWYGMTQLRNNATDTAQWMASMLKGAYPYAEMQPQATTTLGSQMNASGVMANTARFTGIPTRKPPQDEQRERLLRTLMGQEWAVAILAQPLPADYLNQMLWALLEEVAVIASTISHQHQEVTIEMNDASPGVQIGTNRSMSNTLTDKRAEHVLKLIEAEIERLQEAQRNGRWVVDVHLFAADELTVLQLGGLMRGLYSGDSSAPQPVRVHQAHPQATLPSSAFQTPLNSAELATLVQLPRLESPGFRILDHALFDTDMSNLNGTLVLGDILDHQRTTPHQFRLEPNSLTKHGLICGTPGSGKTNSVMNLLLALWNGGNGTSFLVIEPAKSEYRTLVNKIHDVRVYTLGDETVAPLRLNPFAFDILPTGAKTHVQTHIDFLKALFNAAFILYAPMPYVLDTCLHEVYQDCGWDLTTGENWRALGAKSDDDSIFPTLGMLYNKVEEVTQRLGYDKRAEMDVQAGLKARIGALRLGSRGAMMESAHSISIKELLAKPTILELERVGSEEEKAFLIGLLLIRLFEYRTLEARAGGTLSAALSHIIVIEEAHRLLANIPTEVTTESSNTRGQAVESFTNMLAEMRAYGQGVLVVEQIPNKLARDVIKNTNLKLTHRLVAADDRETIGGTTNMNETQQQYLATLVPGEAIAFAEGCDHPLRIRVPDCKRTLGSLPDDTKIRTWMQPLTTRPLYEPVDGIFQVLPETQTNLALRSRAMTTAQHMMSAPPFALAWVALMIAVRYDHEMIPDRLSHVFSLVPTGLPTPVRKAALQVMILRACAESIAEWSHLHQWTYVQTDALRRNLVQNLLNALDSSTQINWKTTTTIARKLMTLTEGLPFLGCAYCPNRCLVRHEGKEIVQDSMFAEDAAYIMTHETNVYDALANFSDSFLTDRFGAMTATVRSSLGFCAFVQFIADQALSRGAQRRHAESSAAYFFP